MNKFHYFILYICVSLDWMIGTGLYPLFPIYAAELGASTAHIGYFLSVIGIAVALGSIFGGWLSDKFQLRKLIYVTGAIVQLPIFFLLTRITTFGQLVLLVAIIWFIGGARVAMLNVLVGIFTKPKNNKKAFTLLTISITAGSLFGGLIMGPIVDYQGFSALFGLCFGITLITTTLGLFLIDKKMLNAPKISEKRVHHNYKNTYIKPFFLLFFASTLVWVVSDIVGLSRSIIMNNIGFSATAISSTVAVAAIVSIPVLFIFGWLTDHYSHQQLLYFSFGLAIVNLLLLTFSNSLLEFYLVIIIQASFYKIGSTIAQAEITDIVPKDVLGKYLSTYNSSLFIGESLGSLYVGFMLQNFGNFYPFIIAIIFPLMAMVLLRLMPKSGGKV